jgi:SAM-dependent methyltransferase
VTGSAQTVRAIAHRFRAAWQALRTPDGQVAAPTAGSRATEEWWELLPFSTHRIELADGLYSASSGVDPSVDVRTRILVDECGGELGDVSIVDLGCLEGGFTLELARRGAKLAVGIEAREISVRRCELARSLLGLGNAEFVLGDVVAQLPRLTDGFDVVLNTGLLYHLDDPAGFLATARRACRRFMLLDTHVAHEHRARDGCSPDVISVERDGRRYRGRTFAEFDEATPAGERERLLWAAWSNPTSFWPLESELVRMLGDAGFTSVEKFEPGDDEVWQVDRADRVMYLCRT